MLNYFKRFSTSFVTGKEVIFYDRRGPIYNGPFSIERFTDDPSINKIDSAMIWGKLLSTFDPINILFIKYIFQEKITKLICFLEIDFGDLTRNPEKWNNIIREK